MKAKLIPIGNSKGVRIPKAVLEQCGLNGEVEMDVRGGAVVIRRVHAVRQGWEKAFANMRSRGDDKLLDGEPSNLNEWDRKEWTW